MAIRNNRNNYRTWLFHLGVVALLSGCSQEEGLPDPTGTDAVLRPDFHVGSVRTRSIVNGHSETGSDGTISSVAVFVTKSDGYTFYPGVTTTGKTNGLSMYTYGSNGSWTTASGYPEVKLSSLEARIYAFSPSSATLTASTNTTSHTIPVILNNAQTFDGSVTWDCKEITDYMYGSNVQAVGSAVAITANNADGSGGSNAGYQPSIYMQHALTQIVFTMERASGSNSPTAYDYVKKVELKSKDNSAIFTTGTGTMSIADGTLSSFTPTVASLTFTPIASTAKQCGPTGNPATVAYGLVAPRTVTAGNTASLSLTVTLNTQASDAANTERVLTVTLPDNQAWEKGYKYIYKVTLSNRAISVNGTEIAGWTTPAGTSEILKPDGFDTI